MGRWVHKEVHGTVLRRAKNCPYCCVLIGKGRRRCSVDHIVPKWYGGTDREANLVACCRRCNIMKANLTLVEFCDKMGFDLQQVKHRILKLTGGSLGDCQ